MVSHVHDDKIKELCNLVRKIRPSLSFSIFEIGALPLKGQREPFHCLTDFFPESYIHAFEVDENLCRKLNEETNGRIKFYPVALGKKDEYRTFYETNHPMCCSLYEPNEELLSKYSNLEVAMLKSVGSLKTISLDDFARQYHIDIIDFIKIDIQGAELDVFMGGETSLKNVVFIVSEVEFIHLYKEQPLFGDVCNYLASKNFMFHKLLGVAGRPIKPLKINNSHNFPSQHMWSDAVFIKGIPELTALSSDQLLKTGILSFIYHSFDVAFICFKNYDQKNGTDLAGFFSRV